MKPSAHVHINDFKSTVVDRLIEYTFTLWSAQCVSNLDLTLATIWHPISHMVANVYAILESYDLIVAKCFIHKHEEIITIIVSPEYKYLTLKNDYLHKDIDGFPFICRTFPYLKNVYLHKDIDGFPFICRTFPYCLDCQAPILNFVHLSQACPMKLIGDVLQC